MAIVALITDFGVEDEYVGSLKGVLLGIDPAAVVVDVTHAIAPQDLAQAAFMLEASYRHFPEGTIHVVVVDPGVGTGRAILCLSQDRRVFLAPDNGVLTLRLDAGGDLHLRRVDNPAFRRPEVSPTFHGRDIIAPTAAHLSRGADFREVGPRMDPGAAVRLGRLRPVVDASGDIHGAIVHVDRFGNLITNVPARALRAGKGEGAPTHISVGGAVITALSRTYADAEPGALLALIGSRGFLEIAVNRGSAGELLGCGPGGGVRIRRPPPAGA